MNNTILNFLKSLNINYDKIDSLEASQVKNVADVNWVISRYSFFKPKSETKLISIEDVVGYDYSWRGLSKGNLINNMSDFFDKDGDSYHSRSVSMLEIPSSQVMQQLDYSFMREPIHLSEVDSGVYNIGNNGLHRFHVIKVHYLNELLKLNPQDKIAKKHLREKYSFMANVSEIDFIKTYSAFLLKSLNNNIQVETYYNEKYELTDNVCLTLNDNYDEKIILSNEQLIDFVNKQMKTFLKTAHKKEKNLFMDKVKLAYDNFDSFKNYYDNILKQKSQEEIAWKSYE